MTHAEFIRVMYSRRAATVAAVMRATLPPGASFAVFTALDKSDDPSEEALAAVITNLDRADVLKLVRRYLEGSPNGKAHHVA